MCQHFLYDGFIYNKFLAHICAGTEIDAPATAVLITESAARAVEKPLDVGAQFLELERACQHILRYKTHIGGDGGGYGRFCPIFCFNGGYWCGFRRNLHLGLNHE